MEETSEHDVELFEPREDAPEAFELAEVTFNFVAPLVELNVARCNGSSGDSIAYRKSVIPFPAD
jgi:hypothetical protein